jgi:membrane protease subunit (stomatin/prohibitin family)
MVLFGKDSGSGLMDVIRCDEQDYLVWKWRPSGEVNSTNRENSIRWGSSLRVKDGEVAVFVYKQNDGTMQDFIVGPHDDIIKTANFPIISSIVGLAYAGKSPFQAEVYFINLAGNLQLKFGVPYFDVFDPRFLDFAVPMSARGTITFNITDYKAFIKLHRMINFEISDFTDQIRDALTKYIKGYIANIPSDKGIPVLQIERKILEINDLIKPHVQEFLVEDFGVNLKRFDLPTIEVDKESVGYQELRHITAQQQTATINSQTETSIKNLQDAQRINAGNVEDSLRIQREEAQRKQRLQTESQHLTAHQIDQQTTVLTAAAEGLGSMGNMNMGVGGADGGLNPAGMMTGLAMGGAMGGQMANMMNQMGQNIQQPQMTPPPPPQIQYSISINGQTAGPFNWAQLQEMVNSGQLSKNIYVWKQGMANWDFAGNVQELAPLFALVPPPPPPPPPM